MPPSNISTAADYADAMMIARRAKNWLFLILLLFLLAQLAIFFVARYSNYVIPSAPTAQPSLAETDPSVTARPATLPTTRTAVAPAHTSLINQALMYLIALIDFL